MAKFKKIMVAMLLVLAMFICPVVFAGQNSGSGSGSSSGTNTNTDTNTYIVAQAEQHKVVGLQNAQLRVRNEEQKQHLEQVMEKIQTRDRERINQLENLIIEESETGEVTAEGLGESKFLHIFKMQKMFKYDISEDGEVVRKLGLLEKLIWSDFV